MTRPDSNRSKNKKKGALRVPSDAVPRRERKESLAEEIDVSDVTGSASIENGTGSDDATGVYADGSVEVPEEVTVQDATAPIEEAAETEDKARPARASTQAISEAEVEVISEAINDNALAPPAVPELAPHGRSEELAPAAASGEAPAASVAAVIPANSNGTVQNELVVTGPPPPPPKKGPPPAPASSAAQQTVKISTRPRAWFDEIFDEDYLRTLPLLTPVATQNEANFVIESLSVEAGAQVLDAGCGYGRHAMELAARGYQIVGLDNSLPLLLRGAEEAQRRGLSIHFVHGDMREIQFDSQFDGAYCIFNTFGYFDDETNRKTAQNLARSLKPGARLVVDVLNRDYIIADLPARVWWEGEGCVVLEEVDFNYFSSRVVSNRSLVFDDGRQIEQEISIRSFSLHELGKLLHSAGLRVIEVSGSMATRGRFFGAQSRDLVVVAERR